MSNPEFGDIVDTNFIYSDVQRKIRYLGESKIINKELSIGIGFIFFYLSFKIIYEEYAIHSEIPESNN